MLSNFDFKKLDRSRSEGRGFMAKHHLYKIWAHTFKKGTWTCPNTCTRAYNVHVVPIIVLRIFSYPKFWCLTFFYDKN